LAGVGLLSQLSWSVGRAPRGATKNRLPGGQAAKDATPRIISTFGQALSNTPSQSKIGLQKDPKLPLGKLKSQKVKLKTISQSSKLLNFDF